MSEQANRHVRFGVFDLDVRTGELRKSGVRLKLQDQPFQILRELVLEPAELVTRERLQQKLWPDDTFVDFEHSLNAGVKKLRDTLGDSARSPRYIETLPKMGYRFIAPVELVAEEEAELADEDASGKPHRWKPLAGVAAVLALIVGIAAWWSRSSSSIDPERLTETALTSYRGIELYPSFSPDGSQVAYSAQREGGPWNIYVEVVGSGRPEQITDSPEDEVAPVWSPDGRSLAFVRSGALDSDNVLMAVPASGGRAREVVRFERRGDQFTSGSWSPDGEWLAFSGRPSPNGPTRIGLVAQRGGEPRWLSDPDPSLIGDVRPVFSPDGSRLAFVRCEGWTSGLNIFVLSLSPDLQPISPARQLTAFDRIAVAPAWTPDGRAILFLGEQGPGQEGLWSVPASGVEEPKLLWRRSGLGLGASGGLAVGQNAVGEIQIGYAVWNRGNDIDVYRADLTGPDKGKAISLISTTAAELGTEYSPNGDRIAYKAGSPTQDVWVCDADGGSPLQLTHLGSRSMSMPHWSPDSSRVVFHARPRGASDIYAVDADGGNLDQLTDDPADDTIPAYSRDGDWIYFSSNRSGDLAIWKMPAEGGEPTRVLDRATLTIQESWDGGTLYFNDAETGDIWQLPLREEQAQPSVMVRGATKSVAGFQVARSGFYYTSGARILCRYNTERAEIEELFPVEGQVKSVHPNETSVLLNVAPPREADLKMLEVKR